MLEHECIICKKKCSIYYSFCNSCHSKITNEIYEEAEKEFDKEYAKTQNEPVSKIFEEAEFEVYHNYVYDNLSDEEYKEKVKEEFFKLYYKEKIKQKLIEYKKNKNQ